MKKVMIITIPIIVILAFLTIVAFSESNADKYKIHQLMLQKDNVCFYKTHMYSLGSIINENGEKQICVLDKDTKIVKWASISN
ncbi:DUF1496 domain-containing protein [Francisella philomiragia]|uniref:DUF1496 domain-containing protein n=1 Tax=Francisella philomiragia TaxID=28110 RepID=UPI0019030465|nr:DUF1496 domain-containing protein [Francisella philomiragia]MBK2341717.1 DUF1496 domain-containing protein [Francisella philomiragia]